MKKLITQFNETGICIVDVNLVCKSWIKSPSKFTILKYNNQFTLVKYGRGENCAKVKISEEQKDDIIEKLDLKEIKDSFFRSASSFKTQSFIESEIERLTSIRMEKYNEIQAMERIIETYKQSIRER